MVAQEPPACAARSELHVEMILVIMVTRKLGRRRSWHFGDHGFRRDEEAGDRGRALKGRAHDLGGVDYPPREAYDGTRLLSTTLQDCFRQGVIGPMGE